MSIYRTDSDGDKDYDGEEYSSYEEYRNQEEDDYYDSLNPINWEF